MRFYFKLTRAQLKVLSAVFSDLVVVWLVATLASPDFSALIRNIFSAIVVWYAAVKSEELLEVL